MEKVISFCRLSDGRVFEENEPTCYLKGGQTKGHVRTYGMMPILFPNEFELDIDTKNLRLEII